MLVRRPYGQAQILSASEFSFEVMTREDSFPLPEIGPRGEQRAARLSGSEGPACRKGREILLAPVTKNVRRG
jgi:hypothetical protein